MSANEVSQPAARDTRQPEQAATATPSTQISSGSNGSAALRGSLRGLSYDAGAAALAPVPPPDAGPGNLVQLKKDEPEVPDMVVTDEQVEEVASTHEERIGQLQDTLEALGMARFKRQRDRSVKKSRSQKTIRKSVFQVLAFWDAETIVAVWLAIRQSDGGEEGYQNFVKKLDKTLMKTYSRETLATFHAATPDERLEMAERFVKKGFLNKVTKREAMGATLILQTLPPAQADAFRAAHPGFEAHLPTAEKAATAIDAEGEADLRARDEKRQADKKKAAEAPEAGDNDNNALFDIVSVADAVAKVEELHAAGGGDALFAELVSLANGGTDGFPWADFRTVVQNLDGRGWIVQLFDQLGFDYLWNAHSRGAVDILSARDPMRNVDAAAAIAKQKKKAISGEEAYVAYQHLRALPEGYRASFRAAYPAGMKAILGRLNESARADVDTNFFSAGEEGTNYQTILERLEDESSWAKDNTTLLEGLIKVALAADLRTEVAEYATQYNAFEVHPQLMADLGITVGGGGAPQVTTEDKEKLKFGEAYKEWKDLRKQRKEDGQKKRILKFGKKGVRIDGLEVDEADDIAGGNIAGITFRDIDDEKDKTTNTMDVTADITKGSVTVFSPKLDIEALRIQAGDALIRSGGIIIEGLDLRATWPTEKNPDNPTQCIFNCGLIEIRDLLVTTSSQIISLKRIAIQSVAFHVAEKPETLDGDASREKAAQVFQQLEPAKSLIRQIVDTLDAIDNVDELGGQLVGGPGGVTLTVGPINLEGLVTSDGIEVDKAAVKGIDARLERLPTRAFEARLSQIAELRDAKNARIQELTGEKSLDEVAAHELSRLKGELAALEKEATDLKTRLTAVDDKGRDLKAREARYLELYEAQKTRALSAEEQADFDAIQADLKGGMTIEIGGVEARGVRQGNGFQAEAINTGAIHGSAIGGTLGATHTPGATDDEGASSDDGSQALGGELTFETASLELKGLVNKGKIPDHHKLRDRFATLQQWGSSRKLIPREKAELEQMKALFASEVFRDADGTMLTYQQVVLELCDLDGKGIVGSERYAALQEALRTTTKVTELTVSGVGARLGGEGTLAEDGSSIEGTFGVSVGEVGAKEIESGGMTIGSASVMGVDVKGNVKGGSDEDGLTGSAGATVDVESAKLTDITVAPGFQMKEAGVNGLSVTCSSADGGTAEVSIEHAHVTGMSLEHRILEARKRLKELEASASRTPGEQREFESLQWQLTELAHYREQLTGAEADFTAARDTLKALVKEREKRSGTAGFDAEANQRAIDAQIGTMRDIKRCVDEYAGKVQDFMGMQVGLGSAEVRNVDAKVSGLDAFRTGLAGKSIAIEAKTSVAKVKSLDLRNEAMHVHLPTANVSSLSARVVLGFEEITEADGTKKTVPSSVLLDRIEVPSVDAQGLSIKTPVEGTGVLIELPSATLKGIKAGGIDSHNLDPRTLTAAASIDQIQADVKTSLGDQIAGQGSFGVKDLSVEALESGELNFGFNDLTLGKLGLSALEHAPQSKIVTQILKMNGRVSGLGKTDLEASVNRKTGETSLGLDLGGITLSGIHYAGGGARLDVNGAVKLGATNARVKAKLNPEVLNAQLGPEGAFDPKAYENPLESLEVERLTVASLSASKVNFQGKTTYQNLKGQKEARTQLELEKAFVRGIHVSGVKLNKDLAIKSAKVKVSSAGITGLGAHLKDNAGDEIFHANASAQVKGLSVQLFSDGKVAGGVDEAMLTNVETASEDLGKVTGFESLDGKTGHARIDELCTRGFKFEAGKVWDPVEKKWIAESDFSLDHAYAKSMEAGLGGTAHEPGVGQGKVLSGFDVKDVRSVTNAEGNVTTVGSLDASVSADVTADQAYVPGSEGTQAWVKIPEYKTNWDLGFVNNVSGHIGLFLPFTSSGIPIKVSFPSINQITKQISSVRSSVQKASGAIRDYLKDAGFYSRWEWLAKIEDRIISWIVDLAADSALGILGYIQDGLNQVKPFIEGKLNNDGSAQVIAGTKARKDKIVDFEKEYRKFEQGIVDDAVTKLSSYGLLFDLCAPSWGSKKRMINDIGWRVYDTMPDWMTFWESSREKERKIKAHKRRVRAQREAEIKELTQGLIDWATDKLKNIHVDLGAKGHGPFSAQRAAMQGPNKDWQPWMSASARANMDAKGSAGTSIGLNFGATFNDFKYIEGTTSLQADELSVSTSARAGMDEKMTARGQLGTKVHGEGITLTNKRE